MVALHRPTSLLSSSESVKRVQSIIHKILSFPKELCHGIWATIDFPIRLARHECIYKRKELAKIRDERAAVLGGLLALRDQLITALQTEKASDIRDGLTAFCAQCSFALGAGTQPSELMEYLDQFTNSALPASISTHALQIQVHALRRPSRLTLVWPQLVLLPPLGLYAARLAYDSRESLNQTAKDAVDTLKGFWKDWLLGPLQDVVKTVRAGTDDGVIITKESVRADLDVCLAHYLS